jgi:hypothetical protein
MSQYIIVARRRQGGRKESLTHAYDRDEAQALVEQFSLALGDSFVVTYQAAKRRQV